MIDKAKIKLDKDWDFSSNIFYQLDLNPPNSKTFLVLTQLAVNQFEYCLCYYAYDQHVYYRWDYNATLTPEMDREHMIWLYPLWRLKSEKLFWHSFQEDELPKVNSLIMFKCTVNKKFNDLSGCNMYHLGIFKKNWFGRTYIKPNVNFFSKTVPFKSVYKWVYLSDVLNLIGDPMEQHMRLVNYAKQ